MPEAATINYNALPHQEAIAYFKEKLLIPSEKWDDLVGSIHAKSFTIAGATKLALLEDFYNTIGEYIANGKSFGEFLKDFDALTAKHGWSYKGDRRTRAKVIFNTNKRSAYMAGKWQQLQRIKKRRPYLIYVTVDDSRVRPEHRIWHLKAYHIDDPFWLTHFPPNGWMCRCYVRSASKADLERLGITVGQSKTINPIEVTDPKTGEVFQKMPGIDIGWDYNVGKAWLSPDVILGQQLMELPERLRKPALSWFDNTYLDQPFKSFVNDTTRKMLSSDKIGNGASIPAGYLSNEIIDYLTGINKPPIGAAIVVRDSDVAHWLRDTKKDRGAGISISLASTLPQLIRDTDAVLYNSNDGTVIFARRLNDGRYAKFVLKLNFKDKLKHNKSRFKEYLNVFKSAGIVEAYNLTEPGYELIKGEVLR